MELITLLGEAERALGKLDMYSQYIPNIDLFIRMHVAKEATQSSKIEGTQTNMEEALMPEDSIPLDRRDDWQEVNKYIEAMGEGIDLLESLPFSARLIKQVHHTLLSSARGANKHPGEFRVSQNWIGGSKISDAIYVPPVAHSVEELMGDIELFAHNEHNHIPELIKIGIIHYQFETIHPFLDGNGRVGRLMIALYLVGVGVIGKPILYISDYLERHRSTYYEKLMRARSHNDIVGWLTFFLQGIIKTAESGIETFSKILALQKDYEQRISSLGARTAKANTLIQAMYKNPIMDTPRISKLLGITKTTAGTLVKELIDKGIFVEITNAKRNRMYALAEYLNIFEA